MPAYADVAMIVYDFARHAIAARYGYYAHAAITLADAISRRHDAAARCVHCYIAAAHYYAAILMPPAPALLQRRRFAPPVTLDAACCYAAVADAAVKICHAAGRNTEQASARRASCCSR